VQDGAAAGARSPLGQLSDRELEVFQLIAQGLPMRDIARHLHRSVKTVETHREHLKGKLGLRSSGELLRYAVEHDRDARERRRRNPRTAARQSRRFRRLRRRPHVAIAK
jgi:DNA-binding CsgD family transcriptional regulator